MKKTCKNEPLKGKPIKEQLMFESLEENSAINVADNLSI